ncbi:MAG: mannose-1-phosphate guanylyltransferase [bacterium]
MRPALFAVILAGGRGTRFWPRSRRARPKQFLTFAGGGTLLQRTVDRIAPIVPLSHVLVVTTRDLAAAVRKDLPRLPRENIIIEPVGRNTAPAVGLAALHALAREDDPLLVVLPSDHHVENAAGFCRAVSAGARFIAREDGLLTFGIPPTRAETGYGYIEARRDAARRTSRAKRPERASGSRANTAVPVRRFIEKPNRARAERLIRSPNVYWNAGVFLWRARTYMGALAEHAPRIGAGLARIEAARGRRGGARAADRIYARIPSLSADYAVLEHARGVFVIPIDVGWSDLGSWNSLAELLRQDADGNVVDGRHVGIATRNSILLAPGKVIATVGVENLIAVDTGDVLFLCDVRRAQDVRELVALLAARGLKTLT